MKSSDLGFVAGVAGFLLAGLALFFAFDARRTADDVHETMGEAGELDSEVMGGFAERLTTLEGAVKAQNGRINRIQEEEQQLRAKVRELIQRLEAVELAMREEGVRVAPAGSGGTTGTVDIGATGEEFEALRKRVFSGEASVDEEAEFWRMARESGVLDDVIEQMEKTVEDNPRDSQGYLNLAGAYTAKLLTVPNGPERGAWAQKALDQYTAVLDYDPEHWDARYNLAFNLSQWPPFMNKGPEAIKHFETLIAQQESRAPETKHANVYLQLANMYRGQGNAERAEEMLRQGLDRHPEHEALTEALDAATR